MKMEILVKKSLKNSSPKFFIATRNNKLALKKNNNPTTPMKKSILLITLVALATFNCTASTFTVTTITDNDTVPAVGAGTGTLRQAIIDANANPGADVIVFTVSGAINLNGLPALTLTDNAGVTIDGTTAPGYATNTNLTGGLNGTLAISINYRDAGLTISSTNNILKALNICLLQNHQGVDTCIRSNA